MARRTAVEAAFFRAEKRREAAARRAAKGWKPINPVTGARKAAKIAKQVALQSESLWTRKY